MMASDLHTTQARNGDRPAHITPQVIVARSPRSGEMLGEVRIATPLQIREVMAEARLGQVAWERLGLERRLLFVHALRDALYRHQTHLLDILVAEQGKVREDAFIEFLAIIELVDYSLRHAPAILAERRASERLLPYRRFWVAQRPYGVALVISPWNYPLYLSLGPIVAALIAGNSVILKPSEYATQIGEALAATITEAGFPPEVFHIVHGLGATGAALIDAGPDCIVFTGSAPTGRKIAQAAARRLIPVTLELGGNDAAIVLADADVPRAARGIAWSAMFNAGQTCGSVERVLVDRRIAGQFVDELRAVIEANLVDSDGAARRELGAMTTPAQLEIVHAQVQDALAHGARAVIGGHPLDSVGCCYAPTILLDVTPDMRVCQEETFGPVVSVLPFDTLEEAIALNNGTEFGLIASLWTRDEALAHRLAARLKVGSVAINAHMEATGLPSTPWGGIKASGYGRLHGAAGLLAMTYSQTINADRFSFLDEPYWYPYTPLKRKLLARLVHLMYGPTWRDRLRALF